MSEADISALLTAAASLIGAEPVKPADAAEGQRKRQTNQLGAEADHLDVVAALAAIPNNGPADWEHWNNVGMATWAATGDTMASNSPRCA